MARFGVQIWQVTYGALHCRLLLALPSLRSSPRSSTGPHHCPHAHAAPYKASRAWSWPGFAGPCTPCEPISTWSRSSRALPCVATRHWRPRLVLRRRASRVSLALPSLARAHAFSGRCSPVVAPSQPRAGPRPSTSAPPREPQSGAPACPRPNPLWPLGPMTYGPHPQNDIKKRRRRIKKIKLIN